MTAETNKSLYDILGIAKEATQEDIKKAFRKLALLHHPDKNNGDKDAEARFKEVSAANDILSDPEKRARYDAGEDPNGRDDMGGFTGNMQDFISMFMGGGGMGGFHPFQQHQQLQVNGQAILSIQDVLQGATKKVQFILLKTTKHGRQTNITQERHERDIKFPPGFSSGMIMRVDVDVPAADGSKTQQVNISVQVHDETGKYQIGPDGMLATLLPLSYPKAILGGMVEVDFIDGKKGNLKVPEGTLPGSTLRAKGQGLPKNPKDSTRGDLMFQIEVTMPEHLSNDAKEALKLFQEELEKQSSSP